jgi:monovalent cation/hydrogen antiporter
MHDVFIQYVYLILIILGLVMLANKLRLAYPIVLVLGGLVLSIFTAFSSITIDPELVFFIFLPPLLYEAAWQISWKEFWRFRRVITGFAFPIVILTSCVIAFFSTALIPGFTLALGFLLGGIISPPDAISATTIMRRLNVSRSMLSIIEGESLLNDASSLIVFRFAVAAIITGQFSLGEAAVNFFLVVAMGIVIGIAVGIIFYALHRWLPITTPIEIVLTVVTPYCMYYAAEHFHFSGVLAVVSGGLFLSNRRQSMLNFRSRIESVNVWNSLVFVLNGFVFMLIGLQLPTIVGQLGEVSLPAAIFFGLAISLVLIVTRMVCVLAASPFTSLMSRFVKVADPNPGWRNPVVVGWAGMRGVVSLAMALSIPLTIDGQPFPYRNLILFITFVVIIVTLVFQGLTLPWVIRKIDPEDKYTKIPEERQELIIQRKIAGVSRDFLKEIYGNRENEYVKNLMHRLELDLRFLDPDGDNNTSDTRAATEGFRRVYLQLLERQRDLLNEMNRLPDFDEELIRKYLSLIDIEELKIRENQVFTEDSKQGMEPPD